MVIHECISCLNTHIYTFHTNSCTYIIIHHETENDSTHVSRPRSFKSHYPYDIFPCGPPNTLPGNFIYVARNMKDVAASSYCYIHNFFSDMSWDTFWPKFVAGKLGTNDYFDHVISWWDHRNDGNILFLKYEDMKKDPTSCISDMASFIGTDISSDVVSKIAEMTAFDNMKNNDTANYEWRFRNSPHKFMRKGAVGDWKNYFTEEQSAHVDKLYKERLSGSGLQFDFE